MTHAPFMRNPHLEGAGFLWRGGPFGVLLIHGFTATTAEVRPLARTLAEHDFSVAAPLLPGHGVEPAELNRCRWEDWSNYAESAYTGLAARCERVVVGGESVGALLALHLAAVHPEIAAVLAFAPAIKLKAGPEKMLALRMLAPIVPSMPKNVADDGLLWQGYTVYPLRGALQVLHLQRHVRRMLPRITQPLLVVQGERDGSVSPQAPNIILAGVRSTVTELHWLPDSGHCVILDCEGDAVARITLSFLARSLPGYSSVMTMAPSSQLDSQL